MKTFFKTTLLITLFSLVIIYSKSIQFECIEYYNRIISYLSNRTVGQTNILTF